MAKSFIEDRWYRRPRTTNEKRQNQERKYVRGKRLPKSLPETWDDIPLRLQKSWKKTRKTQYSIVDKFPKPPAKDKSKYEKHKNRKSDPHVECRWSHRACPECKIAWQKYYKERRQAYKIERAKEAIARQAEQKQLNKLLAVKRHDYK